MFSYFNFIFCAFKKYLIQAIETYSSIFHFNKLINVELNYSENFSRNKFLINGTVDTNENKFKTWLGQL